MGMAAFAVLAFTGNRAAAFPLTLTAIRGTITATPHYGINAAASSNAAVKVTVTLHQVITVLSNEVFLDLGTSPPADMRIALDPFTGGLYLTNHSGFFYDIAVNGLGNFQIRDVATTFDRTTLAEQDTMLVDLSFNGRQPTGGSFEFTLRGYATFKCQRNPAGLKTISLSCARAAGSGQFNSSSSGVSLGSFIAAGSGTPEWNGPYSVYWWWNF